MRMRTLLIAAWLFLVAGFTTAATSAATLRSLYIRTFWATWHHEIVSIEPVGGDVRVRVIRVAPVHEFCPKAVLVRAAERIVRRSTVQAVAGVDVCAISQKAVDTAISRSKTPPLHYIDYMGGGATVVANCDGHERVLNLEDTPPWVNFDTLDRRAPQVSALWNMSAVAAGMLDADLRTSDPEQEALGTSLLPELRSTKYQAAFGDSLVRTLEGYTGPPAQRQLLPPEVLERDALPLTTFVAPIWPPIVLDARAFGDVRLRLTVDPETGTVSEVEKLANSPLLDDAAVKAVRSWKFELAKAPREPIDVTLRFQIRCPND